MPVSKSSVTIVDKEFEPTSVEDLFLKYLSEIVEDLEQKLIDADKDQPGLLLQSIGDNSTVKQEGSKITLSIGMEDYWKFVDEGRRRGAKQPPPDAMLEFISARGLRLKKVVKKGSKRVGKGVKRISRDKEVKQLAFLIGRGIKKHGIKPTHFFTDVVNNELTNRLTKELSEAFQKDIEVYFKPA